MNAETIDTTEFHCCNAILGVLSDWQKEAEVDWETGAYWHGFHRLKAEIDNYDMKTIKSCMKILKKSEFVTFEPCYRSDCKLAGSGYFITAEGILKVVGGGDHGNMKRGRK